MVIKGYKINREVHRGPVTTVYYANHLALGRPVILKVLNSQWTEDKDLIERFRREAKICARMDHPNIVKIFDFRATGESIFLSMEYIEGFNLEKLIRQNKTVNFSELIRIASKILAGLSYAHKRGIIHRDIKPSNIMISVDNEVKITDFGLAVVSDLPGITGQDMVVGSPSYMSPEQVLGNEVDPRSDLFSLGVSLYKFCLQKTPFETDNLGTTIQNVLTKEVENLSSLSATIPSWFSELINKLLAKNREDRPESADAVLKIINSNFNSEKLGEYDHLPETSRRPKVHLSIYSLSNYLQSKIQNRLLLWGIPIILILAFLNSQQSDQVWSENTIERIYHSQLQNKIIPDTNLHKISYKIIEDKDITEENRNEPIGLSLPLADKNTNFSETSIPSTNRSEKSQVFIIAKPWAEVYIDSVYYDDTPLGGPLSLNPGIHFIELKNPNYKTFYQHYNFLPAQSETLVVNMEIKIGFLNIMVLPWANILIDGEYRETSPIRMPITLTEGQHIVMLTNPNFASIIDTIEVISGITLDKKFHMSKYGTEFGYTSSEKSK